MTKSRTFLAALLATACALGAVGCGGASSVVQLDGVQHASISKPMLNHWMQAMAGGGFRQIMGTQGPAGLVSEPANYPRCVKAAKLIAPMTFVGQQQLTDAELNKRCHELHQALKEQAMNFLISVQWTIVEGEHAGIKVTDADIKHAFDAVRKYQYPTEADLRKYLKERQWTLGDIFYQLKRNVFVTRLQPTIEREVQRAGGQRYFAKVALARQKEEIAKTRCKPGYVVSSCREYRGPAKSEGQSSAVIFEALTHGKKS